jgi:5-methylthioadenosine/S-adenosylhomocysteine deaminase
MLRIVVGLVAVARLALTSQRVVLGGGDEPLRVGPARVEVEGGRIARIDEGASTADATDLGAQIVAPAFINAHAHLSMTAFRGLLGPADLERNVVEDLFFKLETPLTADDVRAFTRIGAYECLLHGVGMVWDHYYGGTAVAEALREVGLTGVVAPTLQDLGGPGRHDTDAQFAATLEIDDDARLFDAGIFAALGPHATDTVSENLWHRATETAGTHRLPLHAHVAQSVQEYERAIDEHGCSPVEFLDRAGVLAGAPSLLAVHAIFVSDEDLGRLDPERHTLGYCPLSQQQFCFPAHVPSWLHAGLPWTIGTDASVSNDSTNVQRELNAVAGIRGFAPHSGPAYAAFRSAGGVARAQAVDAVRMDALAHLAPLSDPQFLLSRVWSVPGKMHPKFRAGVIDVGALANLIVLDPDHPTLWPGDDPLRVLAYADAAPAITGMMLCGRWQGELGSFRETVLGDAYADAVTEARRRLTELLRRVRS